MAKGVVGAVSLMALAGCEVHMGSGEPARAPTSPAPAPAPAPAPMPGAAPAPAAAPAPGGVHTLRHVAGRQVLITLPSGGTVYVPAQNGQNPWGSGTQTGGDFEGRVFFIPNTATAVPDVTGQPPSLVLYTKQINIAPGTLANGFPGASTNQTNNFAIRYEGNFVTNVSGSHTIRVVSSDGALVYVDSAKLLDNDGIHPPQEAKGTLNLTPGSHRFRVDYFKGNKDNNVALQVYITPPGGAEALMTSQ